MNFWSSNKPVLCLAPMADVTDAAFRYIIAKYSKQITPHSKSQGEPLTYVTYTEFVSADGLALAPEKGRQKLLKDLEYSEIERPIVAQFFTSKPEMMEKVAALALELGFDGVDINMGCPDKSIEKQKAGAALIKNPKLAREIIIAAKRGTKDKIPVSVKTRIGYNKDELDTWLPEILAENPAAIVVHARTRKEMSKVPARWDRLKRAVEIRNKIQQFSSPKDQKCTDIFLLKNSSCSAQSASQGISDSFGSKIRTLIIGNGDVVNVADAHKKCKETGADGAMIGRGVFGNPWLFSDHTPTIKERLEALIEHSNLFEEKFRGIKSFDLMKKHFKSYLLGIADSKILKDKLMQTENAAEVEQLVKDFSIRYN